jgi:uncharacterized protein YvpB
MKKVLVFLISILVFCIGGVYGYHTIINNSDTLPIFIHKQPPDGNYLVKKSGKVISEMKNKEEAINEANEMERSVVIDKSNNKWIYSTLSPFLIITDTSVHDFELFDSAIRYAKRNDYHQIYYNNDKNPIWEQGVKLPEKVKLNVPVVMQSPELPRGCEVTALAMIFEYYDKKISKMDLANNIRKDTTAYKIDKSGNISYGNPYNGFVGDMYDTNKNGYGVYHGPITALANNYFKEKAIDLTGVEFEDVLSFVSNSYPVWVITNSTYGPLEEEYFEIWHTPTGIVKVTKKLHAVVITGYDEKNIYINDPLSSKPNKAVNRIAFQKAWEQMGNQAVTVIK